MRDLVVRRCEPEDYRASRSREPTIDLHTTKARGLGAVTVRHGYPHACTDGLVFMTYTVFDEAVDEEVECLEAVPPLRG